MCEKRKKLITQAILSELSSGVEIYTAKDILVAANIKEENLKELLNKFQNEVEEVTNKEEL
ncbi:hypothetical protein [Clostridium sp. MD294]|nr:hypothetical protein [Clostridium sp. MD294]NDO45994.1 hypothetical protein [Clostridium sp. MD294]USF30344.1 hypothetical protein C820_001785 [Clostridium sp. MD294]